MNGYFVIFAVKSEDNRPIFIMKITDNIIIYEAQEFPQLLMQPFYSDYVGIVICHQGMFRFCVDGTSFVASEGETVFLSKGVMFHVQETGKNLKYTLLFTVLNRFVTCWAIPWLPCVFMLRFIPNPAMSGRRAMRICLLLMP